MTLTIMHRSGWRRFIGCLLLLTAAVYCAAEAGTARAAESPIPAPTPATSSAAAPATAAATAQALCDVLLKVMKQGSSLDFAGRVKILDPELRRLYDLPLVTRLVVGPPWRGMSAEDQQAVTAAFSDYSTAVYASRFKDYSGEKFVVDPTTTKLASGDTVVHTKLLPHGGDTVELDYMEREAANGWHIIDVLLSGTISEMAERRSEYSSAVRDGGAAALIRLLHEKTAQLAAQH
jgi:phospholipid transport system substrate-binding protein